MNNKLKINDAIKIRKEYLKEQNTKELATKYNTSESEILLIVKHYIYPTKITNDLINRIRNEIGEDKLKLIVKEHNQSNKEAIAFEESQGMPIGNWQDITEEQIIINRCNQLIQQTNWVIQQETKRQTNYKTIAKLKEAENIREEYKAGITINQLGKAYNKSINTIKRIINHESNSMEMTDKLVNQLIKEEIKILTRERRKAKEKAKNKFIKLPKSNTEKEDNQAINRIEKELKATLKAIDKKEINTNEIATTKAKNIIRKNQAMIRFSNLNNDE